MVRHKMKHERYSRLIAKMQRAAPPSIASLDDESTNGWLNEADVPESDSSTTLSIMPDVTRETSFCTSQTIDACRTGPWMWIQLCMLY